MTEFLAGDGQGSPKKPCRFCGEQMPKTASYCKECKYFQDWRRFLNFGSTNLALLTALVSVIVTGFPTINAMRSFTEVSVTYFDMDGPQMVLFVSNSGNKPGGATNLRAVVERGGMSADVGLSPTRPSTLADLFVGPGTTRLVAFDLDIPPEMRVVLQSSGVEECFIAYSEITFEGGMRPEGMQIPCYELISLLTKRLLEPSTAP